jgi:hypothetical protein
LIVRPPNCPTAPLLARAQWLLARRNLLPAYLH